MLNRKFVRQENLRDCGVACLLMIMRKYGGNYPFEKLREMMNISKDGTTALDLIQTARKVGFDARGYQNVNYEDIKCPSIAHVIVDKTYHHFVVIEKVDLKRKSIIISDPAQGIRKCSFVSFDDIWTHVVITLYPIRKIERISTFNDIKKTFLQIIKPHTRTFIFIFSSSILYTIFNIIGTFYFKVIIDTPFLSMSLCFYWFGIFLFITIMKTFTDYFRNIMLIKIDAKVDGKLMKDTYKRLLSLPWQYFNSRHTGDIISRLNDLSYVKELISKMAVILLIDLVFIIGSMIVLFNLNISLFLVTLIALVIYMMVVLLFNRSVKYRIIKNQVLGSLVSSSLVETIGGINTIKNMSIEDQMYEKSMGKYDDLIENNYMLDRTYCLAKLLKDLVIGIFTIVVLFVGSILVSKKSLSIGDLVMFNFFLTFFLEPLRNIFDMEPLLRASASALRRTSEFNDKSCDEIGEVAETVCGSIILKDLNFSYNNKDNIINNINIRINAGEKVMINGASGSGKSTLARLLMRYYDAMPRQILIDGKDILEYSISTIRNNFCYVSQQETIFADSLYNNIVLYRAFNENKIQTILKLTHVDEITERHKLDYHMLLEENGLNLSGGERQRIMLARALLRDNQVYILDESMSEMSIALERCILKELFSKYSDKTIIVISHRLDNADLYDKFLSIEGNKKIMEKGECV